MTIPFFKNLYKAFSLGMFLTTSLSALSPAQEIRDCKAALLDHLNKKKQASTSGYPVAQKLVIWEAILRVPEQFTPHELINLLEAYSHWPRYEKLCERTEEIVSSQGSPREILTWFEKHPPQTSNGVMAYGATLLSLHQQKKTATLVAKAWPTLDLTQGNEKKFLNQFGQFLSTKDHVARLQVLLSNEDIEAAKRMLAHVPSSMQKIAIIRLAFLNGTPDALQKMQGLSPALSKNEGLLYEKAKWLRKQKNFTAATHLLLDSPCSSILAEKWWKEQNYMARELIALGEYKTAYLLLKKHALKPEVKSYADAEWLLGWIALQFLNAPKDAQTHFKNLYGHAQGALSKSRGAYWMGRAYEKQKSFVLAEKAYRKAASYKTTYYGQLAASKLQDTPYPTFALTPKATAEEKKRFEQNELVKVAYILKGLGKGSAHELSKFLLHIADKAKSKGERELAVHLASTLSPHDVVWAAKKAGYRDPILLKAAFPAQSIPRKGQEIPEKALVMAVAYQESCFNPTAISSANAMGLMQLIASTAAQEAKLLGIAHKESKLYDPQHNLLLGSSHLSRLLNTFNASYILALAAYNAGATPVYRWLKEFGDPRSGKIDIIDWVELIPYAQTRDYVMKVLAMVTVYRSLEGCPKKTLIDDLQR